MSALKASPGTPRRGTPASHDTARSVKSAERVLELLLLLARHPGGLKLRGMAAELKIPVSSLHALLSVLLQKGFLVRDDATGLYRLTNRVYDLAPAVASQGDLLPLALPVMDRVQKATGESVTLSVLQGDRIVFLAKRSSPAIIQVVNDYGSQLPAHATGSGKAILAHLPEAEIDRIFPGEALPRYTAHTVTSKAELKRVLAQVRRQGYAYDAEESVEGLWAVAACIMDRSGEPLAATSIVAPAFRVPQDRVVEWQRLVMDAAAEIGRLLGGPTA